MCVCVCVCVCVCAFTVLTLFVSGRGPLFTQRPTVHTFTHMLPNAQCLDCTVQHNPTTKPNCHSTVHSPQWNVVQHAHIRTHAPTNRGLFRRKTSVDNNKNNRKLLQTHFLCCAVVFFPVRSTGLVRQMTCDRIASQPCTPIGPDPPYAHTVVLHSYQLPSDLEKRGLQNITASPEPTDVRIE